MSALPDLTVHFRAMERLVEALPEGITAEIAHGIYAMSPRPRLGHGVAQGQLLALVKRGLGGAGAGVEEDWLFAVEPELRSETALSRLVPDLAGWRKSGAGWPAFDVNPVEGPMPDWVAEVLSPSTKSFDLGPKREAYGLLGVGFLWIVDVEARRVSTFVNVRGTMVAGPVFSAGEPLAAPPFEGLRISVGELFPA